MSDPSPPSTQTTPTADQCGPLKGIRVIEMGQLIAGPFCGQLLGDMGADVIKVEPPGKGDPMREWGRGSASLWWSVIARNKKSITLNLRSHEGQDLLKRLAQDTDILIENFRPGTMEKWGLGYDILRELNPGLIMVRVSGYGQTGPYAKRAGYGSIGEAMGGLRYQLGYPDRPACRVGISIGDSLAGTYACMGALAALQHRHNTGRGQMVDTAIYEAVLAMMEATVPEYSEGGFVRERTGSILPKVAPSNVYPCQDGELLIGANQDTVFARLATAMHRPDLAEDPRYATHLARGEHQAELDDIIAQWTAQKTVAEVEACMEQHGVPAGRLFKASDMLEDPHYRARDTIVDVPHPEFDHLKMQNVFPRLSESPGTIRWPGPDLGAHNADIFQDLLGLDEADIIALREKGVI
ncbi:MAG: formyl-CoA transferase [Kordiimonas sp.]|nr:formyl-CoA transferase [Kordiimonas sp.]